MVTSVVADIQALIPKANNNRPWWQRHADTHGKLLAEILAAWQAGKFGSRRKTACRAISAYLTQHGIQIGLQGVQEWLTRNPPPAK